MSLLSSQALMRNAVLQDRLQGAIRLESATRLGWAEPDATLARAGFTAPETVAPSFMLRVAANLEISDEACPECGNAGSIPDDTLKWIVSDSWHAVATELYGPTDPGDDPPAA